MLAAAAGVTRFIRLLSHTIKINMAPKTIRNLGDKSEGAKTTRIGRDKGETVGLNKRLTSITGKAAGKNTSGLMKDAKMSDSTTSPSEIKLKGKNQSTIMAFLVGGAQDSPPVHITPSPESNVSGKEPTPLCTSDKKLCIGNKELCTKITQYVENPSEIKDSNRETSEKVLGLPRKGQPQTQQVDQSEQLDYQKESDLSSTDCSFSESEESETSEAGNKSPSYELTVRQFRQRKPVKTCPGSQEGFENAASMSGRTLRWDYSGIGLADTPTVGNQGPANDKTESGIGASAGDAGNAGNTHAMGTEAGILQSIYSSIKELQTETRIESRSARIATKRLQGSVRKVAKSCTEIEAKLCSMEERIVAVEEDMDTLKEQSSARDGQLTDVMWKMEDLENRQRRNNLRFLGIPEGLEGNNIQAYMVNLLRGAFPELGDWDWVFSVK
ncbi:hypothetical protein NDU88_003461 [Pleurodeles waltl]|uniref:Uncharacterized protein n=1 Tax=Pleurodeles waltl TaxID=8319 RepID=A0AAV7RGT8_PLEWA|nr:hypothetical protein NDU88_003461 [Pleurodeles waltl]